METCLALIPARSGSKRVVGKNVRPLAGHPVMAYTIAAALDSGVFSAVVLSTDSEEYARIGRQYGAEVPALRPAALAGDTSSDFEWVSWTLGLLRDSGRSFDAFSILRPTSPFRMPETIRRAWKCFRGQPQADSLRAVELCKQHPGKMWLFKKPWMEPLLSPSRQREIFGQAQGATPWHSCQYQSLPAVYAQNASLEMAWSRVVFEGGTIAGEKVVPFVTEGHEGFDVNHECDWHVAEHLVREGSARLPEITRVPCPGIC